MRFKMSSSFTTSQLSLSSLPTGRVLSIITPDAQRTMFTVLGASSEMVPEEMAEKYLQQSLSIKESTDTFFALPRFYHSFLL